MEDKSVPLDPEALHELASYRMPFGKHKGMRLVDLPEPYVVWFSQQGFPKGKLGRLLAEVYEIKVNGLEYLFNSEGAVTPGAADPTRRAARRSWTFK